MPEQLYLVAHMFVKEEEADSFEPIFQEHARLSRAKQGCLFFYLVRETDDPTRFYTMEAWDSREYFEQHVADDEHKSFEPKLKKALAKDPQVHIGKLIMGME